MSSVDQWISDHILLVIGVTIFYLLGGILSAGFMYKLIYGVLEIGHDDRTASYTYTFSVTLWPITMGFIVILMLVVKLVQLGTRLATLID